MIGLPQGIYDELSDNEYHGDAESLSSSGARKLLDCPAKFDHDRRSTSTTSDAFNLGHAFHSWTLGAGSPIVEVEADSWRTKAAQGERDAIRADGCVPLLTADFAKVTSMTDSVRAHPDASKLLAEGTPERSLFWHDQESGVMLRARPDWTRVLPDGRLLLIDLKSSVSADPREFASSAAKWAYSFQEAFYRHVHAGLGLEVAEFLFIVTEKQAPYLTSVIRIDADDIAAEYPRIEQAKQLYRECTASGNWPGYPTGINDISLPQWYRKAIA